MKMLWPLLWLVGFRAYHDGQMMVLKLPRWLPDKRGFAHKLASEIRYDKPWRIEA